MTIPNPKNKRNVYVRLSMHTPFIDIVGNMNHSFALKSTGMLAFFYFY